MSRQIFEVVSDEFRKHPRAEITLPSPATPGSAGYDFMIPVTIRKDDLVAAKNGRVKIFFDVKAKLKDDEVLELFIRSSVGIKKKWRLTNCVGIIDSDYYDNPDTGGNIIGEFLNEDVYRNQLEPGTYVMQGVVKKIVKDDTPPREDKRVGGVGSSGK